MTEPLKQFIKETLERNEPCPFKQPYQGHNYCYLLLEDACHFQGNDEFVAGMVFGRTHFKGCYQGRGLQEELD